MLILDKFEIIIQIIAVNLTEIASTLENFNTLVFDRHTLAKWLHMVQVLSPFAMYLP